jgi:hypothetical protein
MLVEAGRLEQDVVRDWKQSPANNVPERPLHAMPGAIVGGGQHVPYVYDHNVHYPHPPHHIGAYPMPIFHGHLQRAMPPIPRQDCETIENMHHKANQTGLSHHHEK